MKCTLTFKLDELNNIIPGARESYLALVPNFGKKNALLVLMDAVENAEKFVKNGESSSISKKKVAIKNGESKTMRYVMTRFKRGTDNRAVDNSKDVVNRDIEQRAKYINEQAPFFVTEPIHAFEESNAFYALRLSPKKVYHYAIANRADMAINNKEELVKFANQFKPTKTYPYILAKDDLQELKDIEIIEDELIESGRSKLVSKDVDYRRALYARRSALKQLLNGDRARDSRLLAEIAAIDVKIARVDKKIEATKSELKNESIPAMIDQDMQKVQKVLNPSSVKEEAGLTDSDFIMARNIANIWIKAGDFSDPANHLLLSASEIADPANAELIKKLSEARTQFELVHQELQEMARDRIETKLGFAAVTTIPGRTKITELHDDISWAQKMFMQGSRMESPMLQTLDLMLNDIDAEANLEKNEVWADIDEAFKNVSAEDMELFFQKDADGNYTGKGVELIAHSFYKERQEVFLKNSRNGKFRNANAFKRYSKWVKDNSMRFDPRLLGADELTDVMKDDRFLYVNPQAPTNEEIEQHTTKLKSLLGEQGYAKYRERFAKKMQAFKDRRDAIYLDLMSPDGTITDENAELFRAWLLENSPYVAMDMIDGKVKIPKETVKTDKGTKVIYITPDTRNLVTIPSHAKWYDTNFQKIQASSDLSKAYETFEKVIKFSVSNVGHKGRDLARAGLFLPFMEANMTDSLMGVGKGDFKGQMKDYIKTMINEKNDPTVDPRDRDPITGDVKKSVQLKYAKSNDKMVNDRVEEMMLVKEARGEFKGLTKRQIGEISNKLRTEIINDLYESSTKDIPKLLKALSNETIVYRLRSKEEDFMNIVRNFVANSKGVSKNADGTPIVDRFGNPTPDNDLTNFKEYVEFLLDNKFYNYSTREVTMKLKGKVYTEEEKSRKKILEEAMDEAEKAHNKQLVEQLQTKIDNLGSSKSLDKVGETVLKYTQVKGMGWNLLAGFANVAFGWISNMNAAADGRIVKGHLLAKATLMMMGSIAKNFSYNTVDVMEAKKVRAIMDKLDVLNNSVNELFEQGRGSTAFNKMFKRFSPYAIQERTEYIVQAPIMIAILMDRKIDIVEDGKVVRQVSLWDALDENGNLKDGMKAKGQLIEASRVISSTIAEYHGDYKNKVMAKNFVLGKASLQFRTWMINGINARFGFRDGMFDISRGVHIKGRYWSILTGLESIIKGNKLEEVDKANLRANMVDLGMLILVMALASGLKGDDDDDSDLEWYSILGFNLLARVGTDLLFYSSPDEFNRLVSTPLPAMSVVDDLYSVGNALTRQFGDTPTLETGPFKGTNVLLRETGKLIPGVSQAMRTYARSNAILNKN